MKNTMPNSVTILAISLSIVALLLSVYAASGVWKMSETPTLFSETGGGGYEGDNFEQAVQNEINKFIESEQARAQGGNQVPQGPVDVSVDDDPVKGDPDAPITIIEFSDYQCPYCESFFVNTLPQLTQEYIDTGKAKLVYRDFPLGSIHPQARPAAIAAECARKQSDDETYFAYHDQLFANIRNLNEDLYTQIATSLSLNLDEFNTCLADPEMGNEVDADFLAGQQAGVSGTPSFFVNGRPLSGAQPFAAFQAIIEEELNK